MNRGLNNLYAAWGHGAPEQLLRWLMPQARQVFLALITNKPEDADK